MNKLIGLWTKFKIIIIIIGVHIIAFIGKQLAETFVPIVTAVKSIPIIGGVLGFILWIPLTLFRFLGTLFNILIIVDIVVLLFLLLRLLLRFVKKRKLKNSYLNQKESFTKDSEEVLLSTKGAKQKLQKMLSFIKH